MEQIIIVGQPNLRDKIQSPRLEQFAQRISVSYHLSAMNLKETNAYIAYRLEKAGGSPGLFSGEVIEKIFEASAGIPRTINLLCDAALVYGYADGTNQITLDILEQVIEDKGGMGVFTRQKLNNSPKTLPENDPIRKLEEKIIRMEQNIELLNKNFDIQLKEAESRAEFCRDEMVLNLKRLLASERKRNSKLEQQFGRFKGNMELAARLKRSKRKNK